MWKRNIVLRNKMLERRRGSGTWEYAYVMGWDRRADGRDGKRQRSMIVVSYSFHSDPFTMENFYYDLVF